MKKKKILNEIHRLREENEKIRNEIAVIKREKAIKVTVPGEWFTKPFPMYVEGSPKKVN